MMMCVLCDPKSPLGEDLGSRDPVGMNTTNCNVPKNLKKIFLEYLRKKYDIFSRQCDESSHHIAVHTLIVYLLGEKGLTVDKTNITSQKRFLKKAQSNVLENISSIFLLSFGDK